MSNRVRMGETVPANFESMPYSMADTNVNLGNYNMQPTRPAGEDTRSTDISVKPEKGSNTVVVDEIEPNVRRTVGWVVGIKGACCGRDYHLHAGLNLIGRNPEYAIYIQDEDVSRDASAQIIYDEKHNRFSIAPRAASETTNLCYLNGELLQMPMKIEAYDRIELGSSELVFVPLCCDQFQWSEEK